jgi:hypothetical protein
MTNGKDKKNKFNADYIEIWCNLGSLLEKYFYNRC